ncbi:MAG: sigma-70 family RNA polymerase sigma factor [Chloroflexota bacterium]|nr:sigma-70 family RNA polymerase sigma factor [Chloroflexota bacterium]
MISTANMNTSNVDITRWNPISTDGWNTVAKSEAHTQGPSSLVKTLPELPTWKECKDDQLMRSIGMGQTEAFEELYDRYVRGCFGLAMKIVRDPSVAEEVVQDVFMKLWSQPGIFSPERGKFSGWLLTLVHNRSVDKLRRLKTRQGRIILPLDSEGEGEVSLADLLPDNAPTPHEAAWTGEKGRIVRDALRLLPEPQRQAITMAYFNGLTQKEIADQLQEPLGTIKTRTRSALQQLRRALAVQGLLGDLR